MPSYIHRIPDEKCYLSDIKFAVILSMCSVTDISATVTPIGVKFCMMVHIGPGHKAPPLWAVSPKSKMLAL